MELISIFVGDDFDALLIAIPVGAQKCFLGPVVLVSKNPADPVGAQVVFISRSDSVSPPHLKRLSRSSRKDFTAILRVNTLYEAQQKKKKTSFSPSKENYRILTFFFLFIFFLTLPETIRYTLLCL